MEWAQREVFMQTFLYYFRSALPLLAAAAVLGAAAYFIALAVLKRRGRRLSGAWKLHLLVSCVYVLALFMLLIVRGDGFSLDGYGWLSLDLFHEYRLLVREFTPNGFINIGMNILIFVPFGFLFALPFGESRRRWLVLPLGLLATLAVEAVQLAARSGVADVDDVFNNFLGVACGFALARLCMNIRARRASRSVLCALAALLHLSPPFAAWGISGLSDYGASDYESGGRAPVTGEISFSSEALDFIEGGPQAFAYYSTPGGTLADARECASEFFARFGGAIESEELYDSLAYLRGGPNYVTYNYAGPVIEYCAGGSLELSEAAVRALLGEWGLDIPEAAEFELLGEESCRFTLYPDGRLGGTVSVDTHGGAVRAGFALFELSEAGSSAMLTRADCEALLRRGAYGGWIESAGEPLEISSAAIEYDLDSKGIYRPFLRLDFDDGSLYLSLPEA